MVMFGLLSSAFDLLTMGAVVGIVIAYLAATETTKRGFFRAQRPTPA
jgi:hypothetical protein